MEFSPHCSSKIKESDYLNMQNARTTYLTILLIVGLSDGDRFPGKLQDEPKNNNEIEFFQQFYVWMDPMDMK